jgi:hypothetical protein
MMKRIQFSFFIVGLTPSKGGCHYIFLCRSSAVLIQFQEKEKSHVK